MILFFVAIFALVSAYPSTYGYGGYKGDYGDYYKKDYGYGNILLLFSKLCWIKYPISFLV